MGLMHLHAEQKSSAVMRVSWRTLILLTELLVTVVAWRYLVAANPVRANALWLVADGHTASTLHFGTADRAAPARVATNADARRP